MIIMRSFEQIIQEINDYYEYRRVKRDGRNPSTGSFAPYARSGVVKLKYCIETGTRDACVTIADKTDYLKIVQEIDENNGGGTAGLVPNVDYEVVLNESDYSDSDFYVVDYYNQSKNFQFEDKTGSLITFSSGSNSVLVSTITENLVKATNGVDFIENVVFTRNISGDLIASGTIVGAGTPFSFTFDTDVFPDFV